MNFRVETYFNSPASLVEGGEGVRGREEDSACSRNEDKRLIILHL